MNPYLLLILQALLIGVNFGLWQDNLAAGVFAAAVWFYAMLAIQEKDL